MVGQIDNWLPLDLQDETARNGAVASADFLDVKKVREKERTASVHTSHMPKPVITFVCKVLHKGLLRYILHTCPNL